MSGRSLPVLEVVPPIHTAPRSAPWAPPTVAEFTVEDTVQPTFHVWTLGCQMNHSDSEEMAGALAAAGCAEAPDLESADLIVISSHGYHGVKRILLGSVAETVIRHASCAVLVLRRSDAE